MVVPALQVAPTSPDDLPSLREVHETAFPSNLEAGLVESLIGHSKAIISLKAAMADQIVGHILFSSVSVRPDGLAGPETQQDVPPANHIATRESPLGLAPLAVLPAFQRQGIGAALVRAGLAACEKNNVPWIVVLGDPAYYGRFGFIPASRYGLTCEFGGGAAFQILETNPGSMPKQGGLVSYAAEFRAVFQE